MSSLWKISLTKPWHLNDYHPEVTSTLLLEFFLASSCIEERFNTKMKDTLSGAEYVKMFFS